MSLKLHNRAEKNHNHRIQLFLGKNNNTCTLFYTSIVDNHKFKRLHIENKFRQLDKFTLNLSNFFDEMFSLQRPFLN